MDAHAAGAGETAEVGELAPQQLVFLSDSAGTFSDFSPLQNLPQHVVGMLPATFNRVCAQPQWSPHVVEACTLVDFAVLSGMERPVFRPAAPAKSSAALPLACFWAQRVFIRRFLNPANPVCSCLLAICPRVGALGFASASRLRNASLC